MREHDKVMGAVKLTILFLICNSAFADVCPPVLHPDSQTVDPSCPGLGALVIVTPGASAEVWWNDNYGFSGNDNDFNDLTELVTTSASGDVTITFTGYSSAWNDEAVFLPPGGVVWQGLFMDSWPVGTSRDLGTYAPGTVLNLGLLSQQGYTFVTGPGNLNPDGLVHAWVTDPPGNIQPTPEPRWAILPTLLCLIIGAYLRGKRGARLDERGLRA